MIPSLDTPDLGQWSHYLCTVGYISVTFQQNVFFFYMVTWESTENKIVYVAPGLEKVDHPWA